MNMAKTMMAGDDRVRALREPGEKVSVSVLLNAVQQDILDAQTLGLFNKMERCHRTRMCLHPGKNDRGTYEGVDYGTRTEWPWPGALDYDARVADMLVTELAEKGLLCWKKSERAVQPRDPGDAALEAVAREWTKLTEQALGRGKLRFIRQLELLWNCVGEFGMAGWYEGWRETWQLGRKRMRLEALVVARLMEVQAAQEVAVAEEGGEEMAAEGPDEAEQQRVLEELVALAQDGGAEATVELGRLMQMVDPLLPEAEVKSVVRQWRRDPTAEAEYLRAERGADEPEHWAMIPWVNTIYPPMANEEAEYPRVTTLRWYSEYEVRAMAAREEWNKEAVAKVLENPGLALQLTGVQTNNFGWALNGVDMGLTVSTNSEALRRANQYQIATVWYMAVDKAGLPCVYRTLLHQASPTVALKDEADPLGTGRMPVLWMTREKARTLAALSRGIADDVLTEQLGVKKLTDSMVSQTELRAAPPVLRTMEASGDGLRPWQQIPVSARNLQMGGGLSFLQVPDLSSSSVTMREVLLRGVDERYARGLETDPELKRSRLEKWIMLFCTFYEEMILMVCRNLAVREGMDLGPLERGELEVRVTCDPAAVDLTLAEAKLKALTQLVLPMDRAGIMDMNKLVRVAMRWIDADLAQTAVTSDEVAADRVVEDEKVRIAQMASGILMQYPERATNPQLRMQVLQEYLQVPGNMGKMQADPVFAQQMVKEREYLERQVVQYQENPMVGRTLMPEGVE